jgi:hypothetical protein
MNYNLFLGELIMDRPPPYFPQNQLSPPDPNRYRKFKLVVFGGIALLALGVIGVIAGIAYLIWG